MERQQIYPGMPIKRHVQVMVVRGIALDACIFGRSGTWVYVRVSYKNVLYTTATVKDMGKNPNWISSGNAIWLHFAFEDENECITLELFNKNDVCIGKSKLCFADLAHLLAEQNPEEKTLPVIKSTKSYQRQFGELVIRAQIKQCQAVGELGALDMVVVKGCIKGITHWRSSVSEITAKLSYKHTTFKSETLKKQGDRFCWLEGSGNNFTFLIDSLEANDKVKIQIYNFQDMVAECEIPVESLTRVSSMDVPLLLKGKPTGDIDLTTSYKIKSRSLVPPIRPPQLHSNQHNDRVPPSAPPIVLKSQSSVPPIQPHPLHSNQHEASKVPYFSGPCGGHHTQSAHTAVGGPGLFPDESTMIRDYIRSFQ